MRRNKGWFFVALIIVVLLLAGYLWITLNWSYSKGERAGYLQKLSKKGFVCKTWEGELALISIPGTQQEKFLFTVPDDQVAEKLNKLTGSRVSVSYDEHIGIPSSCFGETSYFVRDVKAVANN